MSALDKFLENHKHDCMLVVVGGKCTCGTDQAIAELVELKEELETRTTQFQEALSESVKDKQTIAQLRKDLEDRTSLFLQEQDQSTQLRTELDEAKKVIALADENGHGECAWCNEMYLIDDHTEDCLYVAFLAKHAKETK